MTSQVDWSSFHGLLSGNRHTPMSQIDKSNVARLALKWVFAVPNAARLQGTPQVYQGIMYVTNTNTVIALDAGTGARLWQFTRPPTQGLVGNARSPGNNRSVSVAGDRVFMQTDNAHLIALNRFTGQVLWDTEMADYKQNYNATGSMLAVENLVIAGTAGGEQGVRGFLAAYDQTTGKEVWRFWTIPARGRAGFGNLGRPRHRARRRTDVAHRKLRSRDQDHLLAHRKRRPGFQRRQPQGRQPLHVFDPGAGCDHRQIEVALSDHAAR